MSERSREIALRDIGSIGHLPTWNDDIRVASSSGGGNRRPPRRAWFRGSRTGELVMRATAITVGVGIVAGAGGWLVLDKSQKARNFEAALLMNRAENNRGEICETSDYDISGTTVVNGLFRLCIRPGNRPLDYTNKTPITVDGQQTMYPRLLRGNTAGTILDEEVTLDVLSRKVVGGIKGFGDAANLIVAEDHTDLADCTADLAGLRTLVRAHAATLATPAFITSTNQTVPAITAANIEAAPIDFYSMGWDQQLVKQANGKTAEVDEFTPISLTCTALAATAS